MIRIFWIAVLIIALLSGCGEYVYEPDLYALESSGQATAQAAQALRRSTQEAAFRREAETTMQAAATQGAAQIELDLLAGRLEATRAAQSLAFEAAAATEAARLEQIRETQGAAYAQATQAALELRMTAEALGGMATQTAIVRRGDLEAIEQDRRQALATIQPLAWLAGFLALVWLVSMTYRRLLDWWIEWRDRKNSLFETRTGTVVFEIGEDGFVTARLLSSRTLPLRPAQSEVQVVKLNSSGTVLSSPINRQALPPGAQNTAALAVELVQAAVERAGESAQTIPGWRELGWSSDRWQRVIGALAAAGLALTRPGVGTFINTEKVQDLGDLLYLLETKQVRIRPAPPVEGPWNG